MGSSCSPGHRRRPATRRRYLASVLAVVLTAALLTGLSAVLAGPAAPATATPSRDGAWSVAPAAPWDWPLHPDPAVVRPFQAPPQPWAPGHRGVDLSATQGEPVLAPAAGVVSFAGTVVDRGVLALTHAGGVRTSYEPVTAVVAVGEVVQRGQVVAVVAPAPIHCDPATCLHWGARVGDRYVDPLRWVLGADPPVLLPLGPVIRRPG